MAVETSLEAAPTLLPDEPMRHALLDRLTAQVAAGDPPFFLDYWRLNLRATRP